MAQRTQFIGGTGILTSQIGPSWVIEIDPAYASDGGSASMPTIPESPNELTYSTEHAESVMPGAWPDGESNNGLKITIQTGVRYEPDGDRILYGFVRDLTFSASGQLASVSPERRIIIDAPEAC